MATILEPLECPLDDVARVPRRFGVGVLMILMTAFAVLFAIMRTFGAPPAVFCVIAGLFLAVTLAQILLFGGKKPREASALAGAVVFPLEIAAAIIWSAWDPREGPAEIAVLIPGVICAVPGGAICGYLAGCIVAGVFFVQENWRRRRVPSVEIGLLPLTEADLDTLVNWLHYRPLFELWSQGQMSYPLSREQLEERFASPVAASAEICGDETASPGLPALRAKAGHLVYKAVCGEMQEMVGVVELANIDYERSRANIELAIVDPTRNDRAQLSGKLVREIVREAFERQGLHWLRAVVSWQAAESLACFRQQDFFDLESPSPAGRPIGYALLVRGRRAGSNWDSAVPAPNEPLACPPRNLVQAFTSQWMYRERRAPPIAISLLPLTEADFDTLVSWVRARPLFDLWSQGQMLYPLDRRQLEDRFEPAATDNTQQATPEHGGEKTGLLRFLAAPAKPAHLAYKAICGEMQVMVGMVELDNIDYERSRANIELAIVDPSRSDRAQLSGELVREIVREAFERQGLHWLRAVVSRRAAESQECFRKQGFSHVDSPVVTEQSPESVVLTRGKRN